MKSFAALPLAALALAAAMSPAAAWFLPGDLDLQKRGMPIVGVEERVSTGDRQQAGVENCWMGRYGQTVCS